jgi:ankyrin repeat protein
MRALLELKASPDGGPDLDATPLMVAAGSGSMGAAALLLEYGAAPSRANAAQEVPLHMAVRAGASEVLKVLLAGNAAVEARCA